ncbi:peptidoglycan/xylan/chitin deacetylase (PgdA/CDA1 family) [Salsuginibacillus halophilus]|uniref:Peptidoglycan/xylan/chitin deacetylase (PgdA/CDA1 family) n=1 Tax=Salsuginibacillus halophilus TaxID=517424 RepID=A0A2P8HQP8_9BACI|nr:polysaccharide deacetylase family protein [Salsuginibacillus halophilus]PSL48546.1 peptidoglycan/xylan/chitin deacetylase (PgdA/CDA1 family) [Salsuginibacillus halophilus]
MLKQMGLGLLAAMLITAPAAAADDPPELRGGPEKDHRESNPLALDELQELFPDNVFLSGPTDQNQIALTFDDGPDPRFTPGVLDVLEEFDVPATFFVMGARAEAEPGLLQRMQDEGHIVGNHTFWHPDLVEEGDVATLLNEVDRTDEIIEEVLGFEPILFRPPYGFLDEELASELVERDYSIIAWSVDSLDWQDLTPDEIRTNVVDDIAPGAIVLMHDGAVAQEDRTETIEALREIIPELQAQGYEFVTVPDLLNIPYAR